MKNTRRLWCLLIVAGVAGLFVAGVDSIAPDSSTVPGILLRQAPAAEPQIDFERARQLLAKERQGEVLTPEEQQFLDKAREARRQRMGERGQPPSRSPDLFV